MNEELLVEKRRQEILVEVDAIRKKQQELAEKGEDDAGFNFNNFFSRVPDVRDPKPRPIKNQEFFEALQSVISKLGLSEKLQEQFDIFKYSYDRNGKDPDFSYTKFTPQQKLAARSQIQELLIPVYVELRVRGFSYEDICN